MSSSHGIAPSNKEYFTPAPINKRLHAHAASVADLEHSLSTLSLSTQHLKKSTQALPAKNEQQNFNLLPTAHLQRLILNLLYQFANTKEQNTLRSLIQLLPYYASRLTCYADEPFVGIMTPELLQATKHDTAQITHALHNRITSFQLTEEPPLMSKNDEWTQLACLITRLNQNSLTVAHIAQVLKEWKVNTKPLPTEMAPLLHSFALFVTTEKTSHQNQLENIYREFCQLVEDSHYKNALFAHTLGHAAVLRKAREGYNMEDHVAYLACVLFDEDTLRFHELSTKDKLANVLLLLLYWQKTNESKYLDLLLYTIPDCHTYLDLICTKELVSARQNTTETFNQALQTTVDKFLETHPEKLLEPIGSKLFTQLLPTLPATIETEFLANSLCTWYNSKKVTTQEFATAIEFYGDFATRWDRAKEDIQETCYDILDLFSQKSSDSEFCLDVLYLLSSDGKVTVEDWAETIQTGAVKAIFLDLICSATFSHRKRDTIFSHFVRITAPAESLNNAARLTPTLKPTQLRTLLKALNERAKTSTKCPAFKIFTKKARLLEGNKKTYILQEIVKLSPLMRSFELAIRKNPLHPGIDFFVSIARSEHFSAESKKSLYNLYLLDVRCPDHSTVLASRILLAGETDRIKQVCDKLLSIMKKDENSCAIQEFFTFANSSKIDWLVKCEMITYLLEKNTPASLLFATKMSNILPISAVWHLLKKVHAQLPEDVATSRCTLEEILRADWYNDPKMLKADPTWFKKRNISLCTTEDEGVANLVDVFNSLKLDCGLTKAPKHINKIKHAILQTQMWRKKGRKTERSLYKALLTAKIKEELRPKPQIVPEALIQNQELSEKCDVPQIIRPESPSPTDDL